MAIEQEIWELANNISAISMQNAGKDTLGDNKASRALEENRAVTPSTLILRGFVSAQ